MATYAISDIHGHCSEFMILIDKLSIDFHHDKLVLLGDYIDRGPHSTAVVLGIMRIQQEYGSDRMIVLRGNHEQMAMEDGWGAWEGHGISSTGEDALLEYFKSLPLYHEDEHCIFVHGGIRPGVPMAEQDPSDLLWIRESCYLSSKPFSKTVVFGHTPTQHINGVNKPIVMKDRIAIDTGCFFGGYLSAVKFEDGKPVQIVRCPNLAADIA